MDSPERQWRERGLHQAVLAGDERAWRVWYDETCPDLFAYVLWRCGGLRDRAEEIVAETWLVAVRRLHSFDPATGTLLTWLRGIASNLMRNAFRRQRRSPLVSRGDEEPADAPLVRREEAERVARALAELPEHYEAVLRRRYLEGAGVAAVAAERGESLKATESLLSRARAAFRSIYESDEQES